MPQVDSATAGEAGGRARVIEHGAGPLLLLGAPGTGKTELLARRLATLVGDGTAPEAVLSIAATRATARRLRERAEALVPGPYEELWIGSWDELGERLLRQPLRRRRPRSLLRRPRSGRAAGDAARPLRRPAAAPTRDPRQPGRAGGAAAGPDRRPQGRAGRADEPRGAGPRGQRPRRPPPRPSARRRGASSSSPSSTRPTTASSPSPGASTAATSSSPSTACWPNGPTPAPSWRRASSSRWSTSSRSRRRPSGRCSRRSPPRIRIRSSRWRTKGRRAAGPVAGGDSCGRAGASVLGLPPAPPAACGLVSGRSP